MANSIVYSGSTVVSTYDTTGSYTWTKDDRTQTITVIGWGGGGGGGSGRQGATGAAGGGGGGGNGGTFFYTNIPATFFGATETVVVGVGGTGGVAQVTTSTDGNDGTAGTNSSIGSITTTIGVGQKGLASKTSTGGYVGGNSNAGAGGINGEVNIGTGGSFRTITNAPQNDGKSPITSTYWVADGITCAGGGPKENRGANWLNAYNWVYDIDYDGGISNNFVTSTAGGAGGYANSVTESAGGHGASIKDLLGNLILAAGDGGVESGTINGENGNDQVTSGGIITGGTGGGGGGGQSAGAAAGNGGDGGFPGGGGGGGGGSLNGTNSGTGGNGGNGLVIVIEYF